MADPCLDNAAMKVLNLLCANGHPFEGWFANEADYQNQHARGLLTCPLCNDSHIAKALTAPRLNLKAGKSLPAVPRDGDAGVAAVSAQGDVQRELLRAWLGISRALMDSSEDVGQRFAEEARKMHYGEAEGRSIRGKATSQEFHELLDEGVEVLPLMVPDAAKGTLQ